MNLLDSLNELVLSTGDDTSSVRTVLTRGINAGIFAATLKYHPPEYKGVGRFQAQPDQGSFGLAGTDWLEIDLVWNETIDKKVFMMDYEDLMTFVPLISGTSVRYGAVYGDSFYYQPYPSVPQNIVLAYFALPDRLTDPDDEIPLDKHIEYIFSCAMEYYWASKEEGDSQKLWQSFSDRISLPFDQMSLIQRAMKKEPPYDYNVRSSVSQGTTSTTQ